MCREEACSRYSIPEKIISLFETWSEENSRTVTYRDKDMEILSLMVTLDEIGFTAAEIRAYLDSGCQLSMLNERRDSLLRSIHQAEIQLEKVDYLRFCMDRRGAEI